MNRHLLALVAVVAVMSGGTSVALASSRTDEPAPSPCTTATEAVKQAQADLDKAVDDAVNRSRELGVKDETINELRGLVEGGLSEDEIDKAVNLFNESGLKDFNFATDGPLVLRIADLGRKLFEAENERGAACPDPAADDVDCLDFDSRAAAQAKLDEDPSDPNDLDADGDGQACEEVEYEDGVVPDGDDDKAADEKAKDDKAADKKMAQVPDVPDEAPDTGGGPA